LVAVELNLWKPCCEGFSALKEIIQMIINYEFKYFGKIIKSRNRSVITNNDTVAFFKHWNSSSLFPQ
jgi:hypothetical protein